MMIILMSILKNPLLNLIIQETTPILLLNISLIKIKIK